MTEPGVKEPKDCVLWFTEEQGSQKNSIDSQVGIHVSSSFSKMYH